MSTPHKITRHDTPIGPRWAIGSVGWISPDASAAFSSTEMRSPLNSLEVVHNGAVDRLRPEHVVGTVRESQWGPIVRGAAANAFAAAQREAREAREADLRHLQPAQPVDVVLARDVWVSYRAMDRAGRARAIQTADLADLTALRQYGNRVPLEPKTWEMAVKRYRVENRLAESNGASRHPAVATLDNPLVIGADVDAARGEIESWEAAHAARLEAVQTDQATARNLIAFIAAVFDVRPQEVLDGVLGREAA